MAFSDLCLLGNAYKTVENETDQSERIMEENSMVRDLITKILDETGPTEGSSSIQPPGKTINSLTNQYPKNDAGSSFIPPSYNYQNNTIYNFHPNDQNGYNFNMPNGYPNTNGFVSYPENDVNALLGIDPVPDTSTDVLPTPEQLNLLRLAAQEIGGAQFTTPNKYDEKYYDFFEPSQRNSLPEPNMYSVNNFNRPNGLNVEMNYNPNYEAAFNNSQRFPNKFDGYLKDNNQESEALAYLNQLSIAGDRNREENAVNNIEYKMPMDINGHYSNEDFNKMQEERNKMYYNRNFQQQMPPNKNFGENNYYDMMAQVNDRGPMNPNFDFTNQAAVSAAAAAAAASMNFKPNGYNQNDFMQRRDMNQLVLRENFPANGINERNYENQQRVLMRQNQAEMARQMGLIMRSRPPPNQLNVDVSFLHENNHYNLGLGCAIIGPSPTVPPPVLQSPMIDLPLLAPYYAMRMRREDSRSPSSASAVLHAHLDACYEQWRQLERERKRTEAKLALAYPGRAVSSSNSIPVPRLPPCPSRVDRLTVDMLREHTKVLTLMGKMETLRASVCVAQNKKPVKAEESKITVLKRGQDVAEKEKGQESGIDPATFDPSTWREDVKNLAEIAPHSEVESAMLAWRSAVGVVQAARRRELQPHNPHRLARPDPVPQLGEAVKQLSARARRARCAMWCDLTLTVALAPHHALRDPPPAAAPAAVLPTPNESASTSSTPPTAPKTQTLQENASSSTSQSNAKAKPNSDTKEEKPTEAPKPEMKNETAKSSNKPTDKPQDKNQQRRTQNYRKVQRNDFYQRNQRYDNRFMPNRHPYQYLAAGPPIN